MVEINNIIFSNFTESSKNIFSTTFEIRVTIGNRSSYLVFDTIEIVDL